MVAAFIVLLIVALVGGGYIAFDVVRGMRKTTVNAIAEAEAIEVAPEPEADRPSAEKRQELAQTVVEAKESEVSKVAENATPSGAALKQSEIRASVAATEVDSLMKDEVAASMIERANKGSDASKKGIINIDTLSQSFESGETVTLDEIKKRVKGINKNITYIKVLARGTLDKKLTVEADGFSLQAVKMIVLTGGTAVKRQ